MGCCQPSMTCRTIARPRRRSGVMATPHGITSRTRAATPDAGRASSRWLPVGRCGRTPRRRTTMPDRAEIEAVAYVLHEAPPDADLANVARAVIEALDRARD